MKTLLMDETATVGDVCAEMALKVGFQNCTAVGPCFSLHECLDGVTISRVLSPKVPVAEIMSRWTPNSEVPRFVYQVKLFMDSLKKSTDPKVIYMLYIQAVYNTITGLYPCKEDDAVSLAALQVQAKFGSHKSEVHVPPYLQQQLMGLVPAPLFPKKTPQWWESEILHRHSVLNADAQQRPMFLYCAFIAPKEYYGCAFFTTKQKFSNVLPQVLVLGISMGGICLMDKETKSGFEKYGLSQIYRWGYKPDATFYFQVKTPTGAKGPIFEFDTAQGHNMSDLLTDYANQILLELGIKPEQVAAAAANNAASNTNSNTAEQAPAPAPVAAPVPETAPAVPAPAPAAMAPETAAVTIQAVYRGHKVREDLKKHYAAIRIQKHVRGYLAKVQFDRMLDEMAEQLKAN